VGHKCYIAFKYEIEDKEYKRIIQEDLKIDMIDKSLDKEIVSTNEEYIMQKIRRDYISDSTVTIFIIGQRSAENLGWNEQRFIKRELQASLYNGSGNTRNGIIGIVLPSMYDRVYLRREGCSICSQNVSIVDVTNTTVSEFSYNFHIPNGKCHFTEDDRYCVLVKWGDFVKDPECYINKAFEKRTAPIVDKVKVKP